MVPLMILAESRERLKQAFLVAVMAVGVAQGALGGQAGLIGFCLALWLFFAGFNYLEATLPSLVSKTVYAGGKGTALGIYSSFQFLGAFAGGVAGGWVFEQYGSQGIALCSALMALCWWCACWQMSTPRNLDNLVVSLRGDSEARGEWLGRLRVAPGVVDLFMLEEEGTLYLKVDGSEFDPEILPSN